MPAHKPGRFLPNLLGTRKGSTWVALACIVAGATPATAQDSSTNPRGPASAVYQVLEVPAVPRVIVLEFTSLDIQAEWFARVVAMVERAGLPRNRVVSHDELATYLKTRGIGRATMTIGNNVRASDLARFFNLASLQGEALFAGEQELLRRVRDLDVLSELDGAYFAEAPDTVVLTVPSPEAMSLELGFRLTTSIRNAVIEHEVSHAEFFSNVPYADYCERFFRELPRSLQDRFRRVLQERGYDIEIPGLTVNEFQAFLAHTPSVELFGPGHLGVDAAELQRLRVRFRAGMPPRELSRTVLEAVARGVGGNRP